MNEPTTVPSDPRWGLLALLLCVILVGCAPAGDAAGGGARPATPAPGDVIAEYRAALERGEPDAAFALLHPDLRGDMSAQEFRVYFERNREELLEQADRAIEAVRGREPALRARVEAGGRVFAVEQEGEEWRLSAPVWPRSRDATPADVVRSLYEALRRGDLAAIQDDLLDDEGRRALESFLKALGRAAGAVPPHGESRELTLPLDGGGSLTLVRGGEGWRLRGLTLVAAPATP